MFPIGLIILVVLGLVAMLIPGTRRVVLTALNAALQTLLFVVLYLVEFIQNHWRVFLTTVGITIGFFAGALAWLLYSYHIGWEWGIKFMTLVMAFASLGFYLVGLWTRSTLRAATYGRFGKGNPYDSGVAAMVFIILAMSALGWPGFISVLTVIIAFFTIIVWLHGRVLNHTAVYAPTFLLCVAALVTLFSFYNLAVKPADLSQERYLWAVMSKLDTITARASVPVEVESKLTYATLTEKAYVYEARLDQNGNWIGYQHVMVESKDGKFIKLVYEPGKIVKSWNEKAKLDLGREPMIAVEEPDDLGEVVMNTDASRRYIVARKIVTSGPYQKSGPEIIQAKYDGTNPSTINMPDSSSTLKNGGYLLAANNVLQGVAVKKGQLVRIVSSGQANAASSSNDGANRWVGPDGWGSDPGFNTGRRGPLPRGDSFMALVARVSSNGQPPLDDGGWIKVGSNGEFRANQDGIVYVTVNDPVVDASGISHSAWRSDNQGGHNIEFYVQ